MPELWEKSAYGINRKLRELWEKDNPGVNRKVKELWAKDGSGVNRKIYSAAQVGDSYIFGGHNYKVVNVDASTGQAIIVCIDDLGKSVFDPYTAAWERSAARTYLNNDFYNAFSDTEKAHILPITHSTVETATNYVTTDYVWLLQASEIFTEGSQFQWFSLHNSDTERAALFGGRGSLLRDCNTSSISVVGSQGNHEYWECNSRGNFNPAILINP